METSLDPTYDRLKELEAEVTRLREENRQFNAEYVKLAKKYQNDEASEISRLREALEYYAATSNWVIPEGAGDFADFVNATCSVQRDSGLIAHQALAPADVKGTCCANEDRSHRGGCNNCGDPCL